MNWTRSTAKPVLIFLIFLAAALPVMAGGGPLFVRNNSPVYLTLAAPPTTDFSFYSGYRWKLDVLTQYSSMFADSVTDGVSLSSPVSLDMESLTVSFRLERKINAYSSVYMDVPTIMHWAGMFDNLIEHYHDVVGLSNGGRDQVPHDHFAYRSGNLDLEDSQAGIGDIQVGYTIYKIRDISRFRFAFTLFAKLPTGSVANGLSSGSIDFGAAVAMSNRFDSFQLDYGFGMVAHGDPDRRYATSLDDTGFGYAALSSEIWNEIEGVIQVMLSSSPYRTGYDRLDDYQALLTIGVRWGSWEVSFSEDIFSYTAPDITLSINRKIRF